MDRNSVWCLGSLANSSVVFNISGITAHNYSRYSILFMRKVGEGAIVIETATIAKPPSTSSMPTAVSRAAGMALTNAMSKDFGADNIRVNTVCFGLIQVTKY